MKDFYNFSSLNIPTKAAISLICSIWTFFLLFFIMGVVLFLVEVFWGFSL